MNHFVVMGVSSCGKTTVAKALAQRTGAAFIEADALHGAENITKMERGEALNDEDRWPWLKRVADAMNAADEPVFVSCSALRRSYRDFLQEHSVKPLGFIHLHANSAVIRERMAMREGHFMPISLLDSQLALLEPLEANESGVVVDIAKTVEQVVDDALQFVRV